MPAITRFLDRDSVAKAALVAAFSAAALVAVPGGATNLPASAGTVRGLAAMDLEVRRLDGVVGILRDSLRGCLESQGRLLAGLEAGPRPDDRAAVGTARDILTEPGLSDAGRRHLSRHVDLRDACLAWAGRSAAMLSSPGPAARVAVAREAAARDAGYVRMFLSGDVSRVDVDAIEAMETNGPKR